MGAGEQVCEGGQGVCVFIWSSESRLNTASSLHMARAICETREAKQTENGESLVRPAEAVGKPCRPQEAEAASL